MRCHEGSLLSGNAFVLYKIQPSVAVFSTKIADQMRLIEVAGIGRKLGPVRGHALRRQAHVLMEYLNEPGMAQPASER
jgi:hypothetical protein